MKYTKEELSKMNSADLVNLAYNLQQDEQPEETIAEKRFRKLLDKAYNSQNWGDVHEIIRKEQEPNEISIAIHEYPLSNIAIEYLSELAHDNIMENVSYEDYLTEDQAEVYRLALSI